MAMVDSRAALAARVNRGRRDAAHRGGFRRSSHVRATPPCRKTGPDGMRVRIAAIWW